MKQFRKIPATINDTDHFDDFIIGVVQNHIISNGKDSKIRAPFVAALSDPRL